MQAKTRRVAVIGGNRIPFARSNTVYADASNQEMLTAAIDGLVTRFGLEGERVGEVVAGAVLKHSRDFNLTRESRARLQAGRRRPRRTTSSRPATPASRPRSRSPARSRSARSRSASPAAPTPPPTRPIALNEKLRKILLEANRAKTLQGRIAALVEGPARSTSRPSIPQNSEPRTGLSMGESAALTALEWDIGREEQDELAVASHHNLAASYDARLPGRPRHAVPRPRARPEPARATRRWRSSSTLKPVFGKGETATMTAANSTPLTDGASVVLLCSEEYAEARGWEPLAYLTEFETAAVDFVHGGEGLLMAPAYAMPRMLERAGLDAAGLRLLRDPRGVRLAGARHAEGVGGPDLLQGAARPRRAARRDRPRRSSTSTARRWRRATRSPRPAGGSSPTSPSCSPRRAPARRHLDLRRRRPGRHRDPRAAVSS